MSEDRYTRITLRIPKDMHKLLSEEADLTSKSLNAEIIGRLKKSFHIEDEPNQGKELSQEEIKAKLEVEDIKNTILEMKQNLSFLYNREMLLRVRDDGTDSANLELEYLEKKIKGKEKEYADFTSQLAESKLKEALYSESTKKKIRVLRTEYPDWGKW